MESALPLYFSLRLDFGARAIGILFGGAALAHALSRPWMGWVSDRIGRVRVLHIGLAASRVLLPLPVLLESPWAVALAMAALGLNMSFIVAPCSPAVADRVESAGSQSFASGFSLLNFAYSVGMILGPLLVGLLIEAIGIRWAFGASGLGFAAYLGTARGLTT